MVYLSVSLFRCKLLKNNYISQREAGWPIRSLQYEIYSLLFIYLFQNKIYNIYIKKYKFKRSYLFSYKRPEDLVAVQN